MNDVFEVQDEVVQQILTMLTGKIEQSDRERSVSKETENLTAYECVLRGRYFFDDWHAAENDVRRSRDMFEKAIELDPRYAAAYAGLASTYIMEFDGGWSAVYKAAGAKSVELAQKAIELDEQDSYAHLVLAYAYWLVKSNFELARRQLETAIELNPNYYWNYCFGCWFSVCNGDLDTSIIQANEAIRRNPLLPDGCLYTLGFSEYLSKRYDAAIASFCQIAKLKPECYACLAACYAQLNRVEEASKFAEEFIEQNETGKMTIADWRIYWIQYFKFQDDTSIERLIEGLDKAGLVLRSAT